MIRIIVIIHLSLISILPALPSDAQLTALKEGLIGDILVEYCYDCHGDGSKEGEIELDAFDTLDAMRKNPRLWKSVRSQIQNHLMPPRDEDQPSQDERDMLIQWIDDCVFPIDPDHPNPGKITVRRLNISEYEHSIYDLLGVKVKARQILPPDDSGYGFDSIGDVLSLSPSHLEKYDQLATLALQKAYLDEPARTFSFQKSFKAFKGKGFTNKNRRTLLSNGTTTLDLELKPGTYTFELFASADVFGDGPTKARIGLNKKKLQTIEIKTANALPEVYRLNVEVTEANPTLKVTFCNDLFIRGKGDRNLHIHSFFAHGPLEGPAPPLPPSHAKLFPEKQTEESDDAYITRCLTRFARKAFRRPVSDSEIQRYASLAKAHKDAPNLHAAMRPALNAILISPHFLFRELSLISATGKGELTHIDEITLASRLSYFLWSSAPDEELLDLAEKGQLRKQLDSQVDRLLQDPRTLNRLAKHFFHQWLQTQDISIVFPNPRHFRVFRKKKMNYYFREESINFYKYLIKEDLPLTELITANYSLLNRPLAEYYGISDLEIIPEKDFAKVTFPPEAQRRGILTHGSVLTITSNPTRTSPVKRGKWVLENLLDTPPPPAPPNVPSLSGTQDESAKSMREQLIQHRENPACASCHELMDGIGLAMENYDAIGRYRQEESDLPIDNNGNFSSGESFNGAIELSEVIMKSKLSDFKRCVAVKMLTYALGRGTEYYDKPAIEKIVSDAEANDLTVSAYIKAVINSIPFQYYRK